MARERIKMLVLCAMFTALTVLGAYIRIPTPISSFTLQLLFVFLSGVLLGPKYGPLSQLIYVALGLIGIPVFIGGGGISYVLQPAFGFTIGFIASSFVIGMMTKNNKSIPRILLSCICGLAAVYIIGLPYMGIILNVYMQKQMTVWQILLNGMVIFLPFDALKIAATVLLSKPLIKAIDSVGAKKESEQSGDNS